MLKPTNTNSTNHY